MIYFQNIFSNIAHRLEEKKKDKKQEKKKKKVNYEYKNKQKQIMNIRSKEYLKKRKIYINIVYY